MNDDPYTQLIDLNQPPETKIPLVVGQEVEGVAITETRLYTIAELRKMTEEKKPIVHELKAHDFILEEWQPMHLFPQDGHVVEVREPNRSEIARAIWNTKSHKIEMEPASPLDVVRLHSWREIPR